MILYKLLILSLLAGGFLLAGDMTLAADDLQTLSPLRANGAALSGIPGIAVLVGRIIKALLGLIGILSLLFFVLGGVQYMGSQGSAEKIKKGTATLTWATLGLALAFSSYALVEFVLRKMTG